MPYGPTALQQALRTAELVANARRGCHRRSPEPRRCRGELLYLGGSPYQWLAHSREATDDGRSRRCHQARPYAQLWRTESTEGVFTELARVIGRYGLPMALYTDGAPHRCVRARTFAAKVGHIRKTPKVLAPLTVLLKAALSAIASAVRVSRGSMMPSSQTRPVA